MKEINKFFYKITFLIFFVFSAQAESKVLSIGNSEAKVTNKVFSSLTCPHCANFHSNIYEMLKKDYIDRGLVKFEHHAFPLDLAALNAEIIVRCQDNNNKKFIKVLFSLSFFNTLFSCLIYSNSFSFCSRIRTAHFLFCVFWR